MLSNADHFNSVHRLENLHQDAQHARLLKAARAQRPARSWFSRLLSVLHLRPLRHAPA